MKKYAIILSGCGPKDGSEIQESVSAMIAISKSGAEYQIFAPDIPQTQVINHLDDKLMTESRNMLVEAARIARGNALPLHKLDVKDYDALIFPGGFGAAKNLFTFAFDGLDFKVMPDIDRIVKSFHAAGKPIGAMCISPIMIAKVLGNKELPESEQVMVTLGPDGDLPKLAAKTLGARIKNTSGAGEAVTDVKNKIVTLPCYMHPDSRISEIADGAERMIREIEKLF